MERARDDNNNLGVSVKKSNEAISVSVFQSVDGKTRNVERLRVENFRQRQLFFGPCRVAQSEFSVFFSKPGLEILNPLWWIVRSAGNLSQTLLLKKASDSC